MEVAGYFGRAISSKESPDWTLGPYIIQAILLLVAPVCSPELAQNCVLADGEFQPGLVRSDDLHGIWKTRDSTGCRAIHCHSSQMDHEDIRDRRRPILLPPRWWYV